MKRIIAILFLPILMFSCLCSCSNSFGTTYPDDMTNEYCMQNYQYADPNLVFLQCDKGSADGYHNAAGTSFYFKAIKGVPTEDYLVARNNTVMDKNVYYSIVKNRSLGMDNQEILISEIASIEIYERVSVQDQEMRLRKMGQRCYGEQIVKLTDVQADMLMAHIKDSLESKEYEEVGPIKNKMAFTNYQAECYCIRVHFAKYKNLVWDSYITYRDGKYEMTFYRLDPTYSESKDAERDLQNQLYHAPWIMIQIQLPSELAELLPTP